MPNEIFQLKIDALNSTLTARVKECEEHDLDDINIVDAFNDACTGLEMAMLEGDMPEEELHMSMAHIQRGRRYVAQLYLNA